MLVYSRAVGLCLFNAGMTSKKVCCGSRVSGFDELVAVARG